MTDRYRILITGASSGFGKLTAETLAGAGHRVFAGMRDPNGRNASARAGLLTKVGGAAGAVDVVELDVTSDASVDAAVAYVDHHGGGIDVIVNNAGIAAMGVTETFTVEQARDLFEVNVMGVHRVNRAVLPLMRRENRGLLIHISSVLGRYVVPFLGIYTASKFALEALAESYRYELAPLGIESVLVQPGTYPTAIMANMMNPADETRLAGYGSLGERLAGMRAALQSSPKSEGAPDPQDVADAILKLIVMPAGTRPVRVAVDPQGGVFVEEVNRASASVQQQLFGAMGMSDLLTPKR